MELEDKALSCEIVKRQENIEQFKGEDGLENRCTAANKLVSDLKLICSEPGSKEIDLWKVIAMTDEDGVVNDGKPVGELEAKDEQNAEREGLDELNKNLAGEKDEFGVGSMEGTEPDALDSFGKDHVAGRAEKSCAGCFGQIERQSIGRERASSRAPQFDAHFARGDT